MVYLLARGVALCLLLDHCGDPAVVQAFVDDSCRALQETQPPSLLQHAVRLWRRLAEEAVTERAADAPACHGTGDGSEAGEGEGRVPAALLTGTPLSNTVGRLTVPTVLQWLKAAPSLPPARHCGSSDAEARCETAEQLWVLKRLLVLVRHAFRMQLRQVLPPPTPTKVRPKAKSRRDANSAAAKDMEEDTEEEEEEVFRHELVVLVPVHVCRSIHGLSLRQVVDLCSAPTLRGQPRTAASLGLVISPAVSPSDNPHRGEKNRRIEGIQQLMMARGYQEMARVGSRSGPTRDGAAPREQQAESFASFLREASIGFDMQIMALSGGASGYYLAHMRGLSTHACIVCGAVGLVLMLLVDAVLFTLRIGKVDARTRKDKRRRWKLPRGPRSGGGQRDEKPEGSTSAGGDDAGTETAMRAKKNN
ncbi:uncharacterized protein Tco025E_01546 [Trypanosoma conorhini]|uniref:Transmembrane protein n=1 Tax=Trypanosoma conorhini TaxID=83891 RepID=A0A422Q8N4_9TRYP|nr:uncharacterized protein Tco025E_01546 [Trypanosoma conorhini]RNF26345.1 hypothetical protein Tco025E_01546 [Trypanosoma conorhini]